MPSNSVIDAEGDNTSPGSGHDAKLRQEGLMRVGSETGKEGGGHSELVEGALSVKNLVLSIEGTNNRRG